MAKKKRAAKRSAKRKKTAAAGRALTWAEFRRAVPELAQKGEKLFRKTYVVLVGTVRKDGSPRISPVEPEFFDGELYMGMMWRSLKALDLLRDPRCTVHNAIADRMAKHGEFKLHGRARHVTDLAERGRYCDALYKRIRWRPQEPRFHVFAIRVRSAGYFSYAKGKRMVERWRAGGKATRYEQKV